MAAADTPKGDSFAAGKPREWTKTRLKSGFHFDITPNGNRLAAIVADDADSDKLPTHLPFRLNFLDELRRKAPAEK